MAEWDVVAVLSGTVEADTEDEAEEAAMDNLRDFDVVDVEVTQVPIL